ncbi:MAG: Zn-dependent protease [Spirochaetes bacterium]|nr:Zn-dependent protease [Spirochaetota bacterium]
MAGRNKKIKTIKKILLIITFLCIYNFHLQARIIIALQPLGAPLPSAVVETVKKGIKELYQADVVVLPRKDLPAQAYYKPRKRYRAEKLLDYLETIDQKKYTKIVGLTQKDISTTKGKYIDWGILGLGTLGGRACVVSTFRLKRNVTNKKFLERLVKVINHELGHTFGLEHCPDKGCLMQDAGGTVRTVDREKNNFCERCRKRLQTILK